MSRLLLSIAMLLASFPGGAPSQDRQVAGVVQTVSGDWTLQGQSKPLQAGQLLMEGDVPFIGRSTRARLTVALLSRSEHWEQLCTAASPCEGPYGLPKAVQQTGFWSFVSGYLHSDTKVPAIFAGSRAVDSPGPRHALLVLADGTIELNPTLAKMQAGEYRLRFTPQSGSAKAPELRVVTWDGVSAKTPALPAGFYALDAFSADGDHQGIHAAVLLVPASDIADQGRWNAASKSIDLATGADAATANELRLITVLAIRDGEVQ